MKFLSNIPDPYNEKARMYHCFSHNAMVRGKSAMEMEWENHMAWVEENIIGEPKETEYYTSQQLKDMGMVGVYSRD